METVIEEIVEKNELINRKNVKAERLRHYSLYFLFYSFFGWCLETLYAIYVHGHFVKRGFLFGPICPIYGFGALILLFSLSKFKKNPIMIFIISFVSLSVFEYIVSYGLEVLYRTTWWDYHDQFLNINGRICLANSIVWGILGIAFIKWIQPSLEKVLNKLHKIRPNLVSIIATIGVSLWFTDTIVSFILHFYK